MSKPKNPVRVKHLRQACKWAKKARLGPQALGEFGEVRYDQVEWSDECGTACCLHGAAHILATQRLTKTFPATWDYPEIPEDLRPLLDALFWKTSTTPDDVERFLDVYAPDVGLETEESLEE